MLPTFSTLPLRQWLAWARPARDNLPTLGLPRPARGGGIVPRLVRLGVLGLLAITPTVGGLWWVERRVRQRPLKSPAPPPPLRRLHDRTQLICVQRRPQAPCPRTFVPRPPLRGTLALCAAVRDDRDMPEWLAHHRKLGVTAFYLYDYNSFEPLTQRYPNILAHNDVRYSYFNTVADGLPASLAVNRDCIARFAPFHTWMGFIAPNEFIMLPGAGSPRLPEMLHAYADYGGLAINWRQFGSSNHTRRPRGRVVDNYVRCFAANNTNSQHVRVIANTQHLAGIGVDEHTFDFCDGKFSVSEKLEPVLGAFSPAFNMQQAVVNRYVIKSREDFFWMQRLLPHTSPLAQWSYFDHVDEESTELCLYGRQQAGNAGVP